MVTWKSAGGGKRGPNVTRMRVPDGRQVGSASREGGANGRGVKPVKAHQGRSTGREDGACNALLEALCDSVY